MTDPKFFDRDPRSISSPESTPASAETKRHLLTLVTSELSSNGFTDMYTGLRMQTIFPVNERCTLNLSDGGAVDPAKPNLLATVSKTEWGKIVLRDRIIAQRTT